jgi:hydroxylamine reductase (hybrid-cluster protein)
MKSEKSKSSKTGKPKQADRFISGIHNYCDRWCEKCRFTNRCRVYHNDQEYKKENPYMEGDTEAFFKHLTHIFSEIRKMVEKTAIELGIDLDQVKEEAKKEANKNKHEALPTMAEVAENYGHALHDWLKESRERINQTIQTLVVISEDEARKLFEAVETLSWYSFFIAAKLDRALTRFDDDDDEFERYDMLGSAKVATIGIERSIAAHAIILNHMPDEEDTLLGFLTTLEKLRRASYDMFPGAMEFVRPGLDEL